MIEIKDKSGKVLYTSKAASLKEAVEEAVKAGIDLSGANLEGANLAGADLRGADLQEADLHDADLEEADLSGANMKAADMRGAGLNEANLNDANLSGANLSYANLRRANLFEANLDDANLIGASLRGASLPGADLKRADLSNNDTFEYKIIHCGGKLPTRKRATDVGFDLYSVSDVVICPHETKNTHTGVIVVAPPGWYYTIEGRSGMATCGVKPFRGIIDATYEGPVMVALTNISEKTYEVKAGDRIAQMIPHRVEPIFFRQVGLHDRFTHCGRGTSGFGSSGR